MSSGPAKGYVEALEHRLASTENALLRMCLVADERLLEEAFRRDIGNHENHAPFTSATSTPRRAEVKKATESIAQWESLPLNTAEDLRRWATSSWGPSVIKETSARNGGEISEEDTALQIKSPPSATPAQHFGAAAQGLSNMAQPAQIEPHALLAPVAATRQPGRDRNSIRAALTEEFKRQYLW